MKDIDRRSVLKGLGGLAVVSATGGIIEELTAAETDVSVIPAVPNKPFEDLINAVQAYAQRSV